MGHISSMEDIGSACQDGWNGLPSRRPVMEMTIPSSLDKTISPPGTEKFYPPQTIMHRFILYILLSFDHQQRAPRRTQ